MRTCVSVLVVPIGFAALLYPDPLIAQTSSPGPARVISAVRVAEADLIRIDGVPDEPAWERVQPATGFLQRDPDNGAPATERTEVRILYDADRMILSVICHDSEPDRVLDMRDPGHRAGRAIAPVHDRGVELVGAVVGEHRAAPGVEARIVLSTTTAASTASSALPPSARTFAPASSAVPSAASYSACCASLMRALSIVPAPP